MICLELDDEIQIFVEIGQFLLRAVEIVFWQDSSMFAQLLEYFVPVWPAVSLSPVYKVFGVCVFRGTETISLSFKFLILERLAECVKASWLVPFSLL